MPAQKKNPQWQEFGDSATWERLLRDSQKLIAVQDLNSLLPKIPETAGTVLGAGIVILYEYREETDDVNLPPVVWGDLHYPEILMGRGIIRPHRQSAVFKMLDKRRKRPVYASDARKDWDRLIGLLPHEQKGRKKKDFVHRESIVSSAAVCLRTDDERMGVLFVNYHNHHAFPNEERKAIELFAAQVAISIQNARLFQSERERSRALDLIQQASARIGASPDETETLDLIIKGAMQLLGMDSGVIHLVDEAQQAVIRSYEAPPGFGHPVPRFSERKGKTWWVVKTGNTVVVPDITKDDSIHPRMSQMNVRAVLGAPLKVGGKVIGVLSLNDSKVHKFAEYEKTLLTMLADTAAIAIQNTQREKKRREAETLASINAFGTNFVHKVINLLGTLPANYKQVAQAVKRGDQKTLDMHLALLEKDVQSVRQIMQAAKDLRSFGQGIRQPLQINEVTQEAIQEAHLPADIHLETVFDPALPLVTANRITMSNLLGNLISNAVKAMPQGGNLRLTSCTSDDHKSILVTVEDTGTGISEDIRPRIFEPFYTTRGDGLGLGLWLARLTVQEIGGEIEFVSECDKGTVFTIRLPIH